MAEENETQTEEPKELKRYRVKLDGNRGETVMKLTEEDAEEMGDRVLGEHDSEQKQFGMPENETKHVDQTASEQSPEEQEKARQTANKSRSGSAPKTNNK